MRKALLVVGLVVLSAAAAADDYSWDMLRADGRVALIRHTDAPGGAGDPLGFRVEDCASQRNLSEKGRRDAAALGERFRLRAVNVTKVLSSRWCRCQETARLIDVGEVVPESAFDNAFVLRERAAELTAAAREIIGAWKGPGVLVVVTHGANILPLTNIHPQEGEVVVVAPEASSQSKLRVVGRIAFAP
jgi:phosphohistidine phosphatase SixA